MTYILGSKCRDGVVLIADRRFTINEGDELFGQFSGIIKGFSGTRGKFELFQIELEQYINIARGHNRIISRKIYFENFRDYKKVRRF